MSLIVRQRFCGVHLAQNATVELKVDCDATDCQIFTNWLYWDMIPEDISTTRRLLALTDIIHVRETLRTAELITREIARPEGRRSATDGHTISCLEQRPFSDTDDSQFRAGFHQLSLELKLKVLESLDPRSFAVLHKLCGDYSAPYRQQLSTLLHHSLYAQAEVNRGKNASRSYRNILSARETLVQWMRLDCLPHRNATQHTEVRIAPDFCCYLTLCTEKKILNVWSLGQNSMQCVMMEENVHFAGYLQPDVFWYISEADGKITLRLSSTTFSHDVILQPSVLKNYDHFALSNSFYFLGGEDEPKLLKFTRDCMVNVLIPPQMRDVDYAAFSSDNKSGVFYDLNTLFWVDMKLPITVRAAVAERGDVERMLFSPNGRCLVGYGNRAIKLWSCADPYRKPAVCEFQYGKVGADGIQYPIIKSLVFSCDSRHIFVVLELDCDKYNLVVLKTNNEELRHIHQRPCEANVSLAPYLDRFLFVGTKCVDLGGHLQRDM